MQFENVNHNVKVTNLDELNKLIIEAKALADQLREKQEQISRWRPIVTSNKLKS